MLPFVCSKIPQPGPPPDPILHIHTGQTSSLCPVGFAATPAEEK